MGAVTDSTGSASPLRLVRALVVVTVLVATQLRVPALAQDEPPASRPTHSTGTGGTVPDEALLDELQADIDRARDARERAKALVADARRRLDELNDRQHDLERQLHDM